MSVTFDQAAVKPGAKGEVVATFHVGGRRGVHEKLIIVKTDAPASTETLLRMTVDIQEALTLAPAQLIWKRGEVPKAKTIEATASAGTGAKIVSATASNPAFTVDYTRIDEHKAYPLSVTPKATNAPSACQIALVTDTPAATPQTLYISARVE